MPEWLQAVNQINPITYLIEAIRALMVTGFDWDLIGQRAAVDRDHGRRAPGRHDLGFQQSRALSHRLR